MMKNNMIIGIDIDDTLVSTSESFNEIIKKYNINFHPEYIDEEKDIMFKKYVEEIFENVKIKEGAKEVINYLDSLGYKLVIITARSNNFSKNIKDKTIEFIKKENLNISEIYFEQYIKADLAKKLNLDLMIDDNIEVYNNMKNNNIDCILFGDKIKTWKEVLEYIKDKEKDNG